MAADRSKPDAFGYTLPEMAGRVRPLPDLRVGKTLAQRLIPTVDKIRQLNTSFGLRPYRVWLVHLRWTGPARGMGVAEVVSRREILPTPRVEDMGSTARELAAVGLTEEGSLRLTEVSATLSEDDLLGRTPDIRRPDLPRTGIQAYEFYYEVQHQRRPDEPAVRRIYVPDAAADLKPGRFGWTVHLKRRQGDPARVDGVPTPRTRF